MTYVELLDTSPLLQELEQLEKLYIIVEELRAFFGFCILMGINHLPSIDDYWSRDHHYHYAPIADRISRKRFRDISRYLHFVDNDDLATQ